MTLLGLLVVIAVAVVVLMAADRLGGTARMVVLLVLAIIGLIFLASMLGITSQTRLF